MKGGNKSKKRGEVGNQRPERKERERERESERKQQHHHELLKILTFFRLKTR